jgi:hypothetical protein
MAVVVGSIWWTKMINILFSDHSLPTLAQLHSKSLEERDTLVLARFVLVSRKSEELHVITILLVVL